MNADKTARYDWATWDMYGLITNARLRENYCNVGNCNTEAGTNRIQTPVSESTKSKSQDFIYSNASKIHHLFWDPSAFELWLLHCIFDFDPWCSNSLKAKHYSFETHLDVKSLADNILWFSKQWNTLFLQDSFAVNTSSSLNLSNKKKRVS